MCVYVCQAHIHFNESFSTQYILYDRRTIFNKYQSRMYQIISTGFHCTEQTPTEAEYREPRKAKRVE